MTLVAVAVASGTEHRSRGREEKAFLESQKKSSGKRGYP